MKPGLVEAVSLEALQQDGELVLGWKPPAGHIPSHCLEYEVMTEHTNQDGREWRVSQHTPFLSQHNAT